MHNSDSRSLNEIISLTLLIMMGLALFASQGAIAPVKQVAENVYDTDPGRVLVQVEHDYGFRHEGE